MIIEVLFAVVAASAPSDTTKLVVKVENLPSVHGTLRCALFDQEKGFPEDAEKALRRVAVSPSQPVCVFEGVAPGTYAVSVLHDANSNNELDTNFVGIPSEAYGASNNNLPSMSAPTWKDARFGISGKPTQTIVVELED